MPSEAKTVRDLRRLWKPHKERLTALHPENPTPIRFHRACSWIARVENGAQQSDHDLDLISLWIAFNSLYGQWEAETRDPKPDRECWRRFVDIVVDYDASGHVAETLIEHRNLVMQLLDDEYLSCYFWEEPSAKRAGQVRRAKHSAQTWYIEKRWIKILDELLDRVYLMRCQLVHGAATYGGKLNRKSLKHCVWMMQRLLPAFLLVWIDHAADHDWGRCAIRHLTPHLFRKSQWAFNSIVHVRGADALLKERKLSNICPFCQPDSKYLWFEDQSGLVLWDAYPVSQGHTLVIPRHHVSSLFELPAVTQVALWQLVSEARGRLEKELEPDGFNVGTNDGKSAGQTVMHAHIHIVPRWNGDVADPRGGIRCVIPAKARYWSGE